MNRERKPKDKADSTVETARQQQHTGNHERPEREGGGSDRFGGTRAGAKNVEPK